MSGISFIRSAVLSLSLSRSLHVASAFQSPKIRGFKSNGRLPSRSAERYTSPSSQQRHAQTSAQQSAVCRRPPPAPRSRQAAEVGGEGKIDISLRRWQLFAVGLVPVCKIRWLDFGFRGNAPPFPAHQPFPFPFHSNAAAPKGITERWGLGGSLIKIKINS